MRPGLAERWYFGVDSVAWLASLASVSFSASLASLASVASWASVLVLSISCDWTNRGLGGLGDGLGGLGGRLSGLGGGGNGGKVGREVGGGVA